MSTESISKLQKFKSFFTKSNIINFSIVAIVLIVIICIAITPITFQNDTFYTIKIGERIVNYGIDMNEHFAWHSDLPYTYPHWLYDLFTYIIYSMFNFDGLYITTCILSCILGISLYITASKISKNNVFSFFTTIGALYLIKGYITARAQLVTFILFVWVIFCIEMFLQTKKKRYGVILAIISLLIANLHCAVWPFLFVLFLPYLAEYIIAVYPAIFKYIAIFITKIKIKIHLLTKNNNQEKLDNLNKILENIDKKDSHLKIQRDQKLQKLHKIRIKKIDTTKWLIVIMIVCFLMGFLTPIGDTPFTYLIKTMSGNTTQNINEHLPMTLANQIEVLIALCIFLIILAFTKVKISLTDLFMLSGLTYLMLSSRRQLSMFAIICSIILAKLLVELFITYFDEEKLLHFNMQFTKIITIIILTICTASLAYYLAYDKFDDKYIDESSYPVQACDYILSNIDLGKARFYNEYNYGSYMLFRGIPVFIDSRADLYSPEFNGDKDIFSDFIDTSNIGKFYEDIFEKYNITHVITYKKSKTNMIITKTNDLHYQELYSDDHFVIYKRLNAKD